MRLTLALSALLALGAGAARAQTVPTIITPAPITGFGTLSVTTSSVALSTATVGPNSPAFPSAGLPGRYLEIKNAVGSASTLYVCILGGTCTTSVGIPLAAGETKTWFPPSINGAFTSPTVITAGSATALVSW